MRVFLDMDGVLVDFFTPINKLFNIPEPPHKYDWFEDYGVSREELVAAGGLDFFSSLEWMPDGQELEQTVRDKFSSESIYLLTAPMPNTGGWTGKAMWVDKHTPWYNKRLIITLAPKSLLAGPDTLLIDDKDENIAEFVAAGGHGILVPRPWNELRGWAGETLQVVKNSLEEF